MMSWTKTDILIELFNVNVCLQIQLMYILISKILNIIINNQFFYYKIIVIITLKLK